MQANGLLTLAPLGSIGSGVRLRHTASNRWPCDALKMLGAARVVVNDSKEELFEMTARLRGRLIQPQGVER